jgi:hypothetical protein
MQLWQEEESYISPPGIYIPKGSIVWIEDERWGKVGRFNEIFDLPDWIRGRPVPRFFRYL